MWPSSSKVSSSSLSLSLSLSLSPRILDHLPENRKQNKKKDISKLTFHPSATNSLDHHRRLSRPHARFQAARRRSRAGRFFFRGFLMNEEISKRHTNRRSTGYVTK
jgi:hypothetical protein